MSYPTNPHFALGPIGKANKPRMFTVRFACRHAGGNVDDNQPHPIHGTQDAGNPPASDTTEANAAIRIGDLLAGLGMDPNGQVAVHHMRATITVPQDATRDLTVALRRQTEGGAFAQVGTPCVLSGSGVGAGEIDETQNQGGVLYERNMFMAINFTTDGAGAAAFAACNLVVEVDIEVL